jgi:hypothetical protein
MGQILYCLLIISVAQMSLSMPVTSHTGKCPELMIDCPNEFTESGMPLTLNAKVINADPKVTLTYKWTVSAGTIISGQGTSTIIIDKAGTEGQSIIVTVEVGGLDANCPQSESCTLSAPALRPMSRRVDGYGSVAPDEEAARLKMFAGQLQNEPDAQGYIMTYFGRRGSKDEAQARADHVKGYLVKVYGIDAERIVALVGGGREKPVIAFWIVPTGARPPQTDYSDW